jgi:DNA-binding NarL/FixJ family response regulator
MSPAPRSVVVASGDRLFAEALAEYLAAREGWLTTSADDGVGALAIIQRVRPDTVVLLGEMPRLDAATLARQVQRRWRDVRVMTLGRQPVPGALPIPPDARVELLVRALTDAATPLDRSDDDDGSPNDVARLRTLTRREFAVLRLVVEGRETPEIAKRLAISTHTVRTHLQNLYAKLGCHSRLEVVRLAARHGLLERGASPKTGELRTGAPSRRSGR